VFEGNTSDPKTLTAQVETLKTRFKLAHVVLVGDRGMITSARIAEDLKPAGLDWISCLKAPQIRDLVAAGPLQLSLFDERDLAEISAPELFPGERLIACRNPLLAGERARKRSALLEATERNLKRVAEAVRRAPKKHTAAVIGLKVGAVIDKHKMAKHFVLDIGDGHVSFRRDEAKIAEACQIGSEVPLERCYRNMIGASNTLVALHAQPGFAKPLVICDHVENLPVHAVAAA
jgi:hypothetical protein